MTPLPLFNQSQTTWQISKYLMPLALVTGVSCLLALGTYFFIFLPSQTRLTETTVTYERIQHIHQQNKAAWNTQQTLRKVWEQLPARKGLTGLGVAISALAKSHNIHIPEIGYDIMDFRHKLAAKGTLSFKAAGRYESIRQFIYELESQWPQLFIEKLTAERTKNPNEVVFSINVSTFLLEDQERATTRESSSL